MSLVSANMTININTLLLPYMLPIKFLPTVNLYCKLCEITKIEVSNASVFSTMFERCTQHFDDKLLIDHYKCQNLCH